VVLLKERYNMKKNILIFVLIFVIIGLLIFIGFSRAKNTDFPQRPEQKLIKIIDKISIELKLSEVQQYDYQKIRDQLEKIIKMNEPPSSDDTGPDRVVDAVIEELRQKKVTGFILKSTIKKVHSKFQIKEEKIIDNLILFANILTQDQKKLLINKIRAIHNKNKMEFFDKFNNRKRRVNHG
jgi:hypothetical protein